MNKVSCATKKSFPTTPGIKVWSENAQQEIFSLCIAL